jgi:hypothetical protein
MISSSSTNEIATELWQLVRERRPMSDDEVIDLVDKLRASREHDMEHRTETSSSLLIEVQWQTERIPVILNPSDTFTTLCACLFVHVFQCAERAAATDSDLRSGMRAFLQLSAADADVCVVAIDKSLIGGLSVVALEMTPSQVHAQLIDEGVQFTYVWQVVDTSVDIGASAGAGAATGAAMGSDDDAEGSDDLITPRGNDVDSPAPVISNRGISSRLLLVPPPGDARRHSRTKTRKRRVRKNTASSSSRTSSTNMLLRGDGVESVPSTPAQPGTPSTPTLRDSATTLLQDASSTPRVAPPTFVSDAKRRGVVDELLVTESEFVADLYMLNAHFAAPLAADKMAGRRKLGKTLFQNIPELLALHTTLLVRLRRAAQMCPPAIASAFSAWLAANDVSEPHAVYAGGYQRALSLIEAARAQQSAPDLPRPPVDDTVTAIGGTLFTDGGTVCAFVGRAASVANGSVAVLPRDLSDAKALQGVAAYLRLNETMQAMRKETFESFLIRPIQRLMRYPLLLRALLSATQTDDPDYSRLCVVIDRIEEIIENVNRSKALRETEDKLAELSRSVAGLEKFKPEGFLLKGLFTEVADTQQPPQQQQWLLFENVLVRCVPTPPQQSGGKSWKALDSLSTARLWVSGEHHDALATVATADTATPVARRAAARQSGVLVFGEAVDDGESDVDDDQTPLSPHHEHSSSSSSPASAAAAAVLTSSTVVDTFGEKVTQVGRKLLVRARTPLDARQ